MWTVAAGNKRLEGPLGNYNGLSDQHLAHYFSNPVIKSHLIKAGLVTREGLIIPEPDLKLVNIQKEKQKSYCELLAAAIVQKALHLEYARQAKIQQNLENLSKIQLVERIKNVYKKTSKVSSDMTVKNDKLCRQCPSSGCVCKTLEENGETRNFSGVKIYPIICHDPTCESQKLSFRDKRPLSVSILSSLKKLSIKESPYLYSIFTRGQRKSFVSSRRLSKSATCNFGKLGSRTVRKISPNSSPNSEVNLEYDIGNNENASSFQLVNRDKVQKRRKFQEKCTLTLYYHGDKPFYTVDEMKNKMQDLVVYQQHCGGNPIVVFKGKKLSKETLTFISQRHPGFPFSITIFIDGIRTLKLSSCCEYRYLKGSRLGGKNGYFSIFSVEGGSPCTKCLNHGFRWACTSLPFRSDVSDAPLKHSSATLSNSKLYDDDEKCHNYFKNEYLNSYESHEGKKNHIQIQSTVIVDQEKIENCFKETSKFPVVIENMQNFPENCNDAEEVKSYSDQLPEEVSDEAYSEIEAGPEQCVDLECYTDSESDCSASHKTSSALKPEKRSSVQELKAVDNHPMLDIRSLSEDAGKERIVYAEVHVTPSSPQR